MDADRFDALAKVLAERTSRRWVFKGLAAAALGALGLGESRPAAATCRPVGSLCREGANCCSRVCGPRDRFGRRTCRCPAPTVACGGSCVDTNSDSANCGACGRSCPSGTTCADGRCTTVTCPEPGYEPCNGVCVPLGKDPTNCGQCGNVCPSGVCENGVCTPSSTCTDGLINGTETDVDCGGACPPCAAGRGCAHGGDCQSGNCVDYVCQPCMLDYSLCNGVCVPLGKDPTNCGQCGNVCPSGVCENGVCTPSSTCISAPDGTICDDGNPCTIVDTCVAGICTAGHPLNCDDGNACTDNFCDRFVGGCVNRPLPPGTACNQKGGTVCDGQGQCVQCLSAADCPGFDTECRTRTCNAGTCGFNFAAAHTPLAAQTVGDCRKVVCDGAGNIVDESDDTDLPADDGNQCTFDVCANGAPSHQPAPEGTLCSQNGGSVCDGNGNCVV